ncbi:MAG: S8 family serine peptidase [Ignavibacteria bacterium]|nr:S8 family serine peptidase [Ignavibacteria bacterium]
MRLKLIFLLLLFSVSLINSQTTFFIKYKESVDKSELLRRIETKEILSSTKSLNIEKSNIKISLFANGLGFSIPNLDRIIKVKIEDKEFIFSDVENTLSSDPDIEYVQQAITYKINNIPNDSLFSTQWALTKIDAVAAWNITKGDETILVGVIDTGIDYEHPDLKNKIAINAGEIGIDSNGNDKRSNGIDDDGNGFIDDFMGWDFTDRNGFPFDSTGGDYLNWDNNPLDENIYSHGTAVSGIIGAEVNNSIGIAGVAPNIRILNLRAFDPDGFGEEDDVTSAILYAVSRGVKVINMSFGDYSFSYVLRDVIRYAYSQNVVLVASSGNSNSSAPHYPSGYSEVISVGNSTKDDYVASTSNYGSTLDLVAPGTGIMTTLRKGVYGDFNGTSAAAPFISAASALILSLDDFSNDEVKQILKSTTDDINEVGWDMRSGAGRLNLYKAVQSLSTSIVKFNFPYQDFATKEDSIPIAITVLSPYFLRYELLWGTGLNPTSWNNLISNGIYQTSKDTILHFSTKTLSDSAYTFRLVIYQSNGRTLEERVNFHVIRKAPEGELVSLFPSYYGERPTVMTAFYTPTPSIVRMLYRQVGEINFGVVSLDGLATNNQFVKKLHYGFIPPQFVKFESDYEIYFEVENLIGAKTFIYDNGRYYRVRTNSLINQISKTELDFSLPPGLLYENPVNILSSESNEVLIRDINNSTVTRILSFNDDNAFTQVDSISERIPKDFGDWNNNGKKNLLSNWGRSTFLLEEQSAGSGRFVDVASIDNSNAWPILVSDIDKDGINELLTVVSDSIIRVYKVRNDFKLDSVGTIRNFTPKSFGKNIFDSPSALVIDTDNDGINELWLVDSDGDIFGYNILPNNVFQPLYSKYIKTDFRSSSNYITSGDFNGDGKKDIAVILHSVSELDIASYHRVIVFNNSRSQLEILYDNAFVDPATEFNSFTRRTYNNVRFVDIDRSGQDELILFLFPYSYIIKYKETGSEIISFDENINANVVFVSDFNKNGVPEIAYPNNNKIIFYEFTSSIKANTPTQLKGFSIDSANVRISWLGSGNKFYIYRSEGTDVFNLYDSTTSNNYIDNNIFINNTYGYKIQSFDISKSIPFSDLSKRMDVFHHRTAHVVSIESKNDKSVFIRFSEKVNPTIENPKSFELYKDQRSIFPNSFAAADQYSYVVTFTESFIDGTNSLQVNDINDLYGSPIKKELLFFNYQYLPTSIEFFVQAFEIISPYQIKIKFNIEVDEESVLNTNNFIFSPNNFVESVTIDNSDKSTIYLSLKGGNAVGSVGKEYRISIENIYSSIVSGKIPINTGAGSVIILTKHSEDLSDVYFYPSPAKINSGNGSVTFANLPKFAEITIWNMNGEKIISLKEKEGNGGLTWNFIRENGETISSGIYIYRIIMLTANNEEVETKLGKIAIVK